MRKIACVVIALAATLLVAQPALSTCQARADQRVVLYGAGDDPGVFLWDSRFRLRAYHIATFDEAQAMLPRALLAGGGTRAVIMRCLARYVQAPYGLGFDDAVEVRILSGPLRGRTGWVSGSDARRVR